MPGAPQELLLYEAQTEGHHASWLRYMTEDLLGAGWRLTLALDQRPNAKARLAEQMADLLAQARVLAARNEQGWVYGKGGVETVAFCQQQAGARRVFLPCLDEVASNCWRRAAFGLMPPASLRGQFGGIYFRPRFLASSSLAPNPLLKRVGFWRLMRGGWLRQVVLLDEYLQADLRARHPGAPIYFIPDTVPAPRKVDRALARERLGLPPLACVFLFYGGAYRRKRLDLAVAAMAGLPANSPAFLLCLGRQPDDPAPARGLGRLCAAGRAHSINRHVSTEEEELGFAACDFVLLPYQAHFGSSGVLTRAAAGGRPVVASDEQLIGRRVREHGLGLMFKSGSAPALRSCLEQAAVMGEEDRARLSRAALRYAAGCTRAAFRAALLQAVEASGPEPPGRTGPA
jgi:glycosyltransferase involved in cell wall biosynthesis